MCNCNYNKNIAAKEPINEYELPKSGLPVANQSLSGLGGLDLNVGILDVAVWAGIFWLGHKFGKHVFGK